MPAKSKTVIPPFYFLLFLAQSRSVQCRKHFLLRKTERYGILAGSGGCHLQVIQIRKNALLWNPCNSCNQPSVKKRIRLKGTVKKTSEKTYRFFPISWQPCFLHGSVIFVKDYNHLFAMHKIWHPMHSACRRRIIHSTLYIFKIFPLVMAQQVSLQKITILRIQIRNNFCNLIFHPLAIYCFHICKTKLYNRKCTLQFSVFFLFPDRKAFKQVASACVFVGEKTFYRTHI